MNESIAKSRFHDMVVRIVSAYCQMGMNRTAAPSSESRSFEKGELWTDGLASFDHNTGDTSCGARW